MAINSFHPYRAPFSRKQLLYSVFYYCPLGGPINLKNPVLCQKSLYKYLNKRRIEALLGARGSDKKKKWLVGQFVTLDQRQTGSLVDKLASPRNAHIYKIISVNKEGFSVSIINMVTVAISEVLQSRLRNLSLVDLETAHFGTPELYKTLAKLTHKLRHKYQSGYQLPQGLKLLSDWPNEKVENVDTVKDTEPEVLDMVESGGEVEEDKVEAEEGWKEVGADNAGHRDLEPEIERTSEHNEETHMNTRFRGRKHVKVYELNMVMNGKKSILKGHGKYKKIMNFNLNLLRTLNKDSFHAHKTALMNHSDICIETFCDICSYLGQVKSFTWDVKNYARYLMPLQNEQPKAFWQYFCERKIVERLQFKFYIFRVSLRVQCFFKRNGLVIC